MRIKTESQVVRKRVAVLIITYNHSEDLVQTIESFRLQDIEDQDLYVTNNGSKDQTSALMKSRFPLINLIDIQDNVGWAEGNNIALRKIIQLEYDYVLLANNDLHFEDPSILSSMVEIADLTKAIVGVSQYHYDAPEVLYHNGRSFPFEFDFPCLELPILEDVEICDYVPGSFALIPASVFKTVGLIDASFFLYVEDTDFALRARLEGYACLTLKSKSILHKVSLTNGVLSPLKIYYQTRNLWILFYKHKLHLKSTFKSLLLLCFWQVRLLTGLAFRGKYSVIIAAFKGFFAGVSGRSGRHENYC